MIYRTHNYKEALHTHVSISETIIVKRSYIKSVNSSGLVTFTDGSTSQGSIKVLVKEGLISP